MQLTLGAKACFPLLLEEARSHLSATAMVETPEEQHITQKLWWLAFKAGDDYKLSFCTAASKQDAVC